MTYRDDPNNPNRNSYPITRETNFTGWIVGAVVALAVVISIFALSNRTDQTNTATNPPETPATTGSATSPPTSPAAPQKTAPSALPPR